MEEETEEGAAEHVRTEEAGRRLTDAKREDEGAVRGRPTRVTSRVKKAAGGCAWYLLEADTCVVWCPRHSDPRYLGYGLGGLES